MRNVAINDLFERTAANKTDPCVQLHLDLNLHIYARNILWNLSPFGNLGIDFRDLGGGRRGMCFVPKRSADDAFGFRPQVIADRFDGAQFEHDAFGMIVGFTSCLRPDDAHEVMLRFPEDYDRLRAGIDLKAALDMMECSDIDFLVNLCEVGIRLRSYDKPVPKEIASLFTLLAS